MRQHITDEHRGYFTMLVNLLDVWRDEDGRLLEPWAIRVYFHFARMCGTSRDGHAEESERETARKCGISAGLAHKARTRLAETGWITLEYDGPPGHESAYITLVDRWAENTEHWGNLKTKRMPSGLRSYSERRAAQRSPDAQGRSDSKRSRLGGERSASESINSVSASAHASGQSVSARTTGNCPKTGEPERPEKGNRTRTGDAAAARGSGFENGRSNDHVRPEDATDEAETSPLSSQLAPANAACNDRLGQEDIAGLSYRIQQIAQDLDDNALASSISHARRLLVESGLEFPRFDNRVKLAWHNTRRQRDQQRLGIPMAYFFEQLKTLTAQRDGGEAQG